MEPYTVEKEEMQMHDVEIDVPTSIQVENTVLVAV